MISTAIRLKKESGSNRLSPEEVAFLEEDHERWLRHYFPHYLQRNNVDVPMASFHDEFWEWILKVAAGEPVPAWLSIWARGAAKSTSVELASVYLAAKNARRYALYVCRTQEQADDHVQNIGALLESERLQQGYPDLTERLVGKHGNVKGWRRNRLRTKSGFTMDALGLDSAARGVRMDEQRPDLILLDDIDDKHDTEETIERNIKTITNSLLPAGAEGLVVYGAQNLVHGDSIFARLADGRADFLMDRIVSGPYPAIEGLEYEVREVSGKPRYFITAGKPTWAGQGLDACEDWMNKIGVSAFMEEFQHAVDRVLGGMYDHIQFRHCSWAEVPEFLRVTVAVDPAVTETKNSDSHGIQVDGLGIDGLTYRLFSWEGITSPEDVMRRAVRKGNELKAQVVIVETNQGGDTWETVYNKAVEDESILYPPAFKSARAGSNQSKIERQGRQLAAYERFELIHVEGTHLVLEGALKRFPAKKPYDLADASFWSWHDLNEPDESEFKRGSSIHVRGARGKW
jgi:hypothetical protein